MMPPRESRSSDAKERLSRDRHRQHQPLGLAVLGDQRHADAAAPWRRAGWRSRPACRRSAISPVTPRSTPNSASSSSRWPCPSRPPRPTISPARTRQRDVAAAGRAQDRSRTSSTGGAVGSAPAAASAGRRGCIRGRSSCSTTSSSVLRAGREGRDIAAVAEHACSRRRARRSRACGARCRAAPAPRRAAASARANTLATSARGQRRGRLVEDQQARACAPAPWRSRPSAGATAAGP